VRVVARSAVFAVHPMPGDELTPRVTGCLPAEIPEARRRPGSCVQSAFSRT
jgi:hypothetical protein